MNTRDHNTLSIGYLGPQGSHSEQAALAFCSFINGQQIVFDPQLCPVPSLNQLMEQVHDNTLSAGIIPIENALYGSVFEVLETLGLQKKALTPRCEFILSIQHALIQKEPGPITTIWSHPQAIGQCQQTLTKRFGNTLQYHYTASTSEAITKLAACSDQEAKGIGVLGNIHTARQYHLLITAEDMSDTEQNQTRFLLIEPIHQHQFQSLLQHTTSLLTQPSLKTSLCLALRNYPGALVDVLQCFKQHQINLSKIESRPSKQRMGEYFFHIDIDADLYSPLFNSLYQSIETHTTQLTHLGPYLCLGLLPPSINDLKK